MRCHLIPDYLDYYPKRVFRHCFSILVCGVVGIGWHSMPAALSQAPDNSKAPDLSKTASAQKFSKPYGYYLNPLLDYIRSNDDQRVKITAIVQSYRGRLEPLRNQYRQKNQVFLNNVAKGQSSEQIMDEQTQLGRLYSEINLYYCQMGLEVRKVLNPDQIIRYEEFKRQQGWSSSKRGSR